MKAFLYTLLYVSLLSGLFAGCASHKRELTGTEKQILSDSLQTIVADSLLIQHLHQSSARMEMRLQHLSFTKPDRLGQQYLQSMTLLDAKKEEKDTVIQQMQRFGRAETESIRNISVDKQAAVRLANEPFRMKWRDLLISVLFFILLLTIGLPAIKHMCDKIVSK